MFSTLTLTDAQIATIDAAATADDALRITGEIGDAYFVRAAYIEAKRGPRALRGFFDATRANVAAKFVTVWAA